MDRSQSDPQFFIPRNARRARTGAHNYLYCCEKDDLNGTLD